MSASVLELLHVCVCVRGGEKGGIQPAPACMCVLGCAGPARTRVLEEESWWEYSRVPARAPACTCAHLPPACKWFQQSTTHTRARARSTHTYLLLVRGSNRVPSLPAEGPSTPHLLEQPQGRGWDIHGSNLEIGQHSLTCSAIECKFWRSLKFDNR